MIRFEEKVKSVDFGTYKDQFTHFGHNKNVLQKSKTVTFPNFLMTVTSYNF